MFDQWSYHYPSTFQAPSSPVRNKPVQTRKRAVSVAHSVALDSHEVPEPELRPRSFSVPGYEPPTNISKLKLETPFSKKELIDLGNPRKWLGPAYDPKTVGINQDLLDQYTNEARLALLHAELAKRSIQLMRSEATAALSGLEDIASGFARVQRESASLRVQNDSSTSGHLKTVELSRDIENNLRIYDILDKASRLLNQPAPRVVRDFATFEQLVQDLGNGLEWCKSHPDFLDIDLYELRFQQCIDRALAVAAAYVTHELKRSASRILPKLGSAHTAQALLWTKFRNDLNSTKARAAAHLVRQHCFAPQQSFSVLAGGNDGRATYSAETTSADKNKDSDKDAKRIFDGLEQSYFSVRSQLLSQEVDRYVASIQPADPSFLEGSFQTVLAEFHALYDKERHLYELLFGPTPSDSFVSWMSGSVCDGLYSVLRRYIVREQGIDRLCSLLMALQGAAATMATSALAQSGLGDAHIPANSNDSLTTLDRADASSMSMNDTFDRHGDDDIEDTPKASNLWKDVLSPIISDAQNRLVFRADLEVDAIGGYKPLGAKDFARKRYPAIQRTIDLLEQVYHLLDDQVFNELAHRCIRECLSSLAIARQSAWAGDAIESEAWNIGQLITLQTEIVEFDLDNRVEYDIDFSGFQTLLWSFTYQRSLRELVHLAMTSVPRVVEHMMDAMEDMYLELRGGAERLTAAFVEEATASLNDLDPSKSIATTGNLRNDIITTLSKLKVEVQKHIVDQKAIDTLLDAAQEGLVQRYADFYVTLILQPGEEGERNQIMDTETMTAWITKQFSPTSEENAS